MSGSASTAADQGFVKVTFSPDPGKALVFDGVSYTEELGRPFEILLDLSLGELFDVSSLLGASVTVKLTQSVSGSTPRYFHGIIARAVYSGMTGGTYRYQVEARPWIWLLSLKTDCAIFQNQSVFDIITTIFRNAGFTDFEDKRQASAGDTQLVYCVQYRETSFAFVTRLMEEYGIYYYMSHEDGKHTLVLCDDPNSHSSVGAAIPYQQKSVEVRGVDDHFWGWSEARALQPGTFTLKDYNFTTPSADLTSKLQGSSTVPNDTLESYEYFGRYPDTGVGGKLTAVRQHAAEKNRKVHSGSTNSRLIRPGVKFTLSDHPLEGLNAEYLAVGTTISVTIAEGSATSDGDSIDTYSTDVKSVPGPTQYGLDRTTERPYIRGPQTAVVVGSSGEEIDPDQYGRVKVKFFWDRSDTTGLDCSCWVRVLQPIAGASWGSVYIPRIGQEVVIEFLEGDPDYPVITGVVYNGTNQPPYTLPDEKTKTVLLKSNSSTGGAGFNELTFDDKAGSELVIFQAQKDYQKTVLNNETVKITQDTTTTVDKGNRSVTVSQGNDSHTVSQGNLSVTVSQGNESHTVSTGNFSLDVSAGKVDITAAQSITLTVGANSIKIDPSGVTINGAQIQATANGGITLSGGPSISATAGMISLN